MRYASRMEKNRVTVNLSSAAADALADIKTTTGVHSTTDQISRALIIYNMTLRSDTELYRRGTDGTLARIVLV